jgi:hypothetical protein
VAKRKRTTSSLEGNVTVALLENLGFKKGKSYWEGALYFTCFGEKLEVRIEHAKDRVEDNQLRALDSLRRCKAKLRLAAHQAIERYIDCTAEQAQLEEGEQCVVVGPTGPKDLVLGDVCIYLIRNRGPKPICFIIWVNVPWDEEHAFFLFFERRGNRWKVTELEMA